MAIRLVDPRAPLCPVPATSWQFSGNRLNLRRRCRGRLRIGSGRHPGWRAAAPYEGFLTVARLRPPVWLRRCGRQISIGISSTATLPDAPHGNRLSGRVRLGLDGFAGCKIARGGLSRVHRHELIRLRNGLRRRARPRLPPQPGFRVGDRRVRCPAQHPCPAPARQALVPAACKARSPPRSAAAR